jgi:hypothetical protein
MLLLSPPMVTFEKELLNTACGENAPFSRKLVAAFVAIFAASLLSLGTSCILSLFALLLFCILPPLLLPFALLLLLLLYDFGFVALPLNPPPSELPSPPPL